MMTDYEKGYLDGLNAAAMACEWNTKGKTSRFSAIIRAMVQKYLLRIENKQK